MNHRRQGFLDPFIEAMPHKLVNELAARVGVSRNTILRWQKNPRTIGQYSVLRLSLLAKTLGIVIDFQSVSDGAGTVDLEAEKSPAQRYTCKACGEKGHRSNHCPKKKKARKGKR